MQEIYTLWIRVTVHRQMNKHFLIRKFVKFSHLNTDFSFCFCEKSKNVVNFNILMEANKNNGIEYYLTLHQEPIQFHVFHYEIQEHLGNPIVHQQELLQLLMQEIDLKQKIKQK